MIEYPKMPPIVVAKTVTELQLPYNAPGWGLEIEANIGSPGHPDGPHDVRMQLKKGIWNKRNVLELISVLTTLADNMQETRDV